MQDDFCKRFFKLPQNTFHEIARGKCRRYPLYVDVYCWCIRYWIKLTKMLLNVAKFRRKWEDNMGVKRQRIVVSKWVWYVWIAEDVGDLIYL